MSVTSLDEPGSDGLTQAQITNDVIRVVVSGGQWPLGKRVIERFKNDGGFEVHEVNQSTDAIDSPLDVFVHLAPGDHDALVERRRSAVIGTPELLHAATVQGAKHVVLLSSAMVYGAWPNNPIPLTEETALRPDFGFAFARQLATVEQLVDDWRESSADRGVCVLRPVPAMAADGASSLVRALAAGMGGRLGEDDVPAQFLHLDDLADAVVLATRKKLNGVYNVAPDGFVHSARAFFVGYGATITFTRSNERSRERLTLAFSTWTDSARSSSICAINVAGFKRAITRRGLDADCHK